MRRRDLIASIPALATAGLAVPAIAGPDTAPTEAPSLNIAGVGLPIIVEGRVRNYIFVTVRLTLGNVTPEALRLKEPYFRDALVKAAHRTPFVVPNDWTVIDARAVSAALMRMAPTLAGRGAITAAQVVLQAPRRRTGVRTR